MHRTSQADYCSCYFHCTLPSPFLKKRKILGRDQHWPATTLAYLVSAYLKKPSWLMEWWEEFRPLPHIADEHWLRCPGTISGPPSSCGFPPTSHSAGGAWCLACSIQPGRSEKERIPGAQRPLADPRLLESAERRETTDTGPPFSSSVPYKPGLLWTWFCRAGSSTGA